MPLDQDGDGKATLDDVCPSDVDVDQRDTDGDWIGDACDPTPATGFAGVALEPIAEARSTRTGERALLPLAGTALSRATGDRLGLLAQAASFRVLDAPFDKAMPLREFYDARTLDHAYATSAAAAAQLRRAGYAELGELGYLYPSALPFGEPVHVRAFRRAADGDHAITTDAGMAAQLLAEGYAEQAALGFALRDEGRLHKPVRVVRTRANADGAPRHHRALGMEPDATSDGPVFRVWPQRLAHSAALHRLRAPGGGEVLATDAAEIASLRAAGHLVEGILGWVLLAAGGVPTEPTLELWRFVNAAGDQRYAADPDEIAALLAEGYAPKLLLGHVATSGVRGPACLGPSPSQLLDQRLAEDAAYPDERAVGTLTNLVAACAVGRLLDGNAPATAFEQDLAARLPNDPETRRELTAQVASWRGLDRDARARALGKLARLDPETCDAPIDLDHLAVAVDAMLFEYVGPPPSLREEFCAGTLYAPTDPGRGAAEARAVTVDASSGGEIDNAMRAAPVLEGVLDTEFVRGHPLIEAAAAANPDIGYPLGGVWTGQACANDSQCAASQGLKCISSTCYAFPILRNNQIHHFTGVNLWDVIDGQVVLRDAENSGVSRLPATVTANEPEDPIRCDRTGPRNRATIGAAPLAPGRFYAISAVNRNGNFYTHGETVPADKDTARAGGRTVHVCWSPDSPYLPLDTVTDCEPLAPPAACPLDGPACTAATGGRWGLTAGQRPRSIVACRQPGASCGETPREFETADTQPRFVFVEAAPPARTVVTKLEGVTCSEETGADWLGDDEMVISMVRQGGPGAPTDSLAVGDTFARDMWSGKRRFDIGHELAALPLSEDGTSLAEGIGTYRLTVMESDGWVGKALITNLLGAGAGALLIKLGIVTGGTAAAVGAPALIALTAAYLMYAGDDPLGSATIQATVSDVTDRGALSHDNMFGPQPSLPGGDLPGQKFVRDNDVAFHPAVDNGVYRNNGAIEACQAPSQCGSNETCFIGACVPTTWTDPVAGQNNQGPGFMERRTFVDGSSSNYELHLGWSTR